MASPGKQVFEYLSSGACCCPYCLNVNGAPCCCGSSVNFDYTVPTCPPCSKIDIFRVMVNAIDDAVRDVDGFFTIAALTNGLLVQAVDSDGSTVLQHYGTDVVPLKTSADFSALAGPDVQAESATPATFAGSVRWTINNSGSPTTLTAGQKFRMVVQDDLSDITQFRVMIQGVDRTY